MAVKSLATIRAAIGFPQQDNNFAERFILQGGLNIEQPTANGDAGKLIYCLNAEANFLGGMKSKGGFEPIDGTRQPSAVFYASLKIAQFFPLLTANKPQSVGVTVTGVTSGATGQFLGFETVNGVQCIVLSRVNPSFIRADWRAPGSGAAADLTEFVNGEQIRTASGVFAQLTADALQSPSIDNFDRAGFYIGLARDLRRAAISAVGAGSGAGRALGVFDLNGQLFAVRNNNGNTASQIWKSNAAGWVSVPLGVRVYFTALNAEMKPGDVISNNAGTITATVRYVVIQFGTTGSGDAAGYFITTAVSGGTFGNGISLRINAIPSATTPAAGSVQVTNVLPADTAANPTNYRFRRYNFSGAPGDTRIYGVNGQGFGFEFDGTVITPIITGLGIAVATFNSVSALEKPTCLAVQSDQLFFGYRGGTLQHSGYQQATAWTAVAGADTRQAGDDIVNLVEDINSAMLIQTRTRNGMLYGDVNENFQLRWLDASFGAYPDTARRMNGGAAFLTDQGVQLQNQTAQFGNFANLSESANVNSLLRALLRESTVQEAAISRDGNLYRLYFTSGKMLSFCITGDGTAANAVVGIGYCDYLMQVTNFWSEASTVSTGTSGQLPPERILFCGADGKVYQDDSGGSFGGAFIAGKMQTQFYRGQDSIANMKRYRQMFVDVLGADAYTNLRFSAEYDDGANYRGIEVPELVTRFLTGGQYQTYSAYNQAFYGPSGKNVVRKQLNGQGVGISLIFTWSSNISLPFNIQAIELVAALRTRRGWR